MREITEKPDCMKMITVKVCTKAGIGRKSGQKNVFSCKLSVKLPRERNFLTVQGDFGEIIVVIRRKLCFLRV